MERLDGSNVTGRVSVMLDDADRLTKPGFVEIEVGRNEPGRSLAGTSVLCLVTVVAWLMTGHAAAVPVTLVGGAALVAAASDIRTSRIPNRVVMFALVALGFSWPLVAVVDDRAPLPLLGDLAGGLALSGAPALFVVWLVAPRVLGGGDWKLLSVLGLAVGYLAPLGATVIVMGAFLGGVVVAAFVRRRNVILGPPLALGYGMAIVAVIVTPELFGSWYG